MQKAYITALYEIIKNDKRVISCLSDSGTDYDELIAREFPQQVINVGISENNQLAVSAGLAATGKIPFVYTTGAFIAYRSYEFLRDDICLQKRNVKLVGMGTGLCWSTLGATHHTTEDIGLLRSLPNLTVFSPASPKELAHVVKEAYEIDGPVYIRMGMSNEEEIFSDDYQFKTGKITEVADGTDVTIFSTGSIISEVLKARDMLQSKGISSRILNVATLKPIDENEVVAELKKQKRVFSVEEHNVIGGLGTILADVIAGNGLDVSLIKLGLPDKFASGFGTKQEVLQANHLDADSIFRIISNMVC